MVTPKKPKVGSKTVVGANGVETITKEDLFDGVLDMVKENPIVQVTPKSLADIQSIDQLECSFLNKLRCGIDEGDTTCLRLALEVLKLRHEKYKVANRSEASVMVFQNFWTNINNLIIGKPTESLDVCAIPALSNSPVLEIIDGELVEDAEVVVTPGVTSSQGDEQ
jgi:hypothetical protein